MHKIMRMKFKLCPIACAAIFFAAANAVLAIDPIDKEFVYKSAPEADLKLVVTLPPAGTSGDKRAAIVFFSGGAWANSNIGQFKDWASYLAQRGMVAVRADYRVSKTHHVGPDQCVEDARSAM